MVELKSISKVERELINRDLVYKPSPLLFMKTQFPKGVITSLNSSSFSTKSFVLFSSQLFYNPSHSIISHSSTFCATTHFYFKIIFKTPLSQSVKHSFGEVGRISPFQNLKAHFHTLHIHVYCMVSMNSMQFCLMTIADLFLILVEPQFGCCEL